MDTLEPARRLANTMPRRHRDEPAMPPGYDEVISSTRYPVLRTSSYDPDVELGNHASDGHVTVPWRLKFVDFTPHLAGNNPRRNITSFEKLLDRANTWLQSNKNVSVVTCETVTWCADDLRRLNDTEVVTTTIKKGNVKKLHFMRGLRVWVTPCPESSDDCVTLGVREFTPDVLDAKALENFDLKALLRKTNSKIWESPLSGDILHIETVLQPTRADTTKEKLPLKVKDTYWTDGAKVDRKYIPIIRVFCSLGARNLNVEIGMTDIVPRVMKQKGRSRYEGQESLMVRASEWIQNQTHVTVTNIQTVTFRRRGFIQGVGFPIFWASTDSEDACVRCLRVAYTKPRTMVTLRVMRPGRYCVRKRTFAPRKSPLSTANSAGRNNQPEDLRYQNFTRTTEEVSLWLDKAGVEILSVETFRQQVHEGRYHTSPDSSLVRPSDDKSREFITLVRIFIKAGSNSSLSGRGPASLFNNPADRPFWIRPNQGSLIRRRRRRRWSHVLIIMVVFVAILIVGVVIALVLAVGRGWF